ncbi:proline--tRNA ligase 2-like [Schistocerca gregaria]|uniref:proline--tRNA ligase 2-like n=1 Tax=Schistocerca gregaria TaxID=7010 RepID=UPI00211DA8EF|nr:proline--tRNA ligase 2-like [Schistocerca gregaria]
MMPSKDAKKETFYIDKDKQFNRWYERVLIEADIMDKRYPIKGMPIFSAYGYHMHNAMMKILEKEWDKLGIDKVQFPILIPELYLKREAQHLAGFSPEVFWVTEGGSKSLEAKSALRPTSETAIYSMFSLWVRSFRDLPLKVHQTCCVYRYETKDTLPLIRAREIYWNEGHTCHATREDALQMLENAWASYLYLLNEHLGVYGKRLRRPEWDKFAGAEHTDVLDCVLPSGKVLQSVGAHYLGQIFAKSFDIHFLTDKNTNEHAYMTCFGVSTRMLASCLATHGDNKGLILPSSIAKYQVVIVPLLYKGKEEMCVEAGKKWKSTLTAANIPCYLDDSEKNPGEKYYYWEMKGVPIRMEVGPRDVENDQVCLVRRDTSEKHFEPSETVIAKIRSLLSNIDNNLRQKAKTKADSYVVTCKTLEEVIKVIETRGGFARIPYFSFDLDGKEGEKIIQEKTNAEIRGYDPTETIEPGMTCLVTGKPAKHWAYVAKSY